MLETLVWLTKYFSGQRAELGGHVTGGLYTMWRPYIKQLSLLLGFMCQQIVVRRAAVVFGNSGEGLDAGNAPFMYRCFSLLYHVLLRALEYLAIIPRVRMGYESIAHEAEGRMGY